LTDDKHACPVNTANCKAFDDSIAERLGPAAQEADFPEEDLTPEYEPYVDVQEDLEATPKAQDNYVGVDLLFPKGGIMARGHVTARKRDADDNPKGHVNDNPILDTREYTVTFDDGDVPKLTANLIAKSMYAQCDPDGSQYVLPDSLIDHHRRLDTALRPPDQTIVRMDRKTYKNQNIVG